MSKIKLKILCVIFATCTFLAACGDGSSASSVKSNQTEAISGTVTGLASGAELVLLDKDMSATVTSDGVFAFPQQVPVGAHYLVYIAQQPNNQVCNLTNQAGTTTGASTDVQISCVGSSSYSGFVPTAGCGCSSSWTYHGKTYTGGVCANPDSDVKGPWCTTTSICNGKTWSYCSASRTQSLFTIGGRLSGIDWDSQLTLQNNLGDNLTLTSNGNFTFPTSQPTGSAYSVTILSGAPTESCTVSSGSGNVSGNVTSVVVDCGHPGGAPSACACMPSWSYGGSTFQGCANPDSDPKGAWCKTAGVCNGVDWAYCS